MDSINDCLTRQFGSAFVTDADRLLPYEEPERGTPGRASGAVVARTEDQVQQLLQFANRQGLGVVISAGRTGLVEAQCPRDEMVLSLERLNRPLAFHPPQGEPLIFESGQHLEQCAERLFAQWEASARADWRLARLEVEAGMSIDAVNALLEPIGLMFPMALGSSAAATVGACVANASAGANAVCYGTAAQMVHSVDGFWANAEPAHCAARPRPDVMAGAPLIDSTRIQPANGLIATQGIFGVITRLCLKLAPIPKSREAALIPVKDMPAAMAIFSALTSVFGNDVEEFEFISASCIDALHQAYGHPPRLPFDAPVDAPYFILMQLKSVHEDDELASRLYEFLSADAGIADEHIGYAPLTALKQIRHGITEASNIRMRQLGGGRLSFDTATAVDRFGDYLQAVGEAVQSLSPELQLLACGHAGVGGAHLHVLGSRAQPVSDFKARLIEQVFDITESFGGTFSAEHGVGPKWAKAFLARRSSRRIEQLIQAKLRHDPNLVLQRRSFGLARAIGERRRGS